MHRKKHSKSMAFIKIIVAAILIVAVYFIVDERMTPIINTLALSRAQNLATVIINDTVAETISDGKNDFYDLIMTE